MGLLAFILLGLLVGFIARAVMPARQSMGLLATTLLGMAGSVVGALVGSVIEGGRHGGRLFQLHPAGLIGAVVGATLVMLLVGFGRGGGRHVEV